MAEASVPVKYLDEITECPICTNVYTDPRVLPCVHTYCLKCIEGWSQQRKPEEKLMACPLCRKEINISTERLATELPKNLFVGKLLEAKKLAGALSNQETPLCEVCDRSRSTGPDEATVYCVECNQRMCQHCSEVHKNMKVSASHKVIKFGSHGLQTEERFVTLSVNTCEKHSDRKLEIYCVECKLAICMMCYLKDHNAHKFLDVNEARAELSKQMKIDSEKIDGKVSECQEVLKQLSDDERSFVDVINTTEKEIVEKAEEMKKLIEKYKMEELDKLRETKCKQLKQIENVRHEVESVLMMLDSFKKYTEQLTGKGSACDVGQFQEVHRTVDR